MSHLAAKGYGDPAQWREMLALWDVVTEVMELNCVWNELQKVSEDWDKIRSSRSGQGSMTTAVTMSTMVYIIPWMRLMTDRLLQ